MTEEEKKLKKREYDRKRYQENKEAIKNRVKRYYADNKEAKLDYQRKYDAVHKIKYNSSYYPELVEKR